MSFIYPTFLWALFAVLIPVIIHLFSFRRHKTVYFSQTRFLENVKKDTQSKSKLRHILILISRILIIAAVVFAFSNPVIIPEGGSSNPQETQIVAIYIDNSFSMQNESEQGSMLDMAKQKAGEIIESYGENCEYVYLTNSMPARYYRSMKKEEIQKESGLTEVTSKYYSLSEIKKRAESVITNIDLEFEKIPFYIISDFQVGMADFDKFGESEVFEYNAVKISPIISKNLSIDSVWFDTPFRRSVQAERLFVKIQNHGSEAYSNVPVRLLVNDSLKSVGSLNIEENEFVILEMNYTNASDGLQQACVELDDYPVSFDNKFYFSYNLNSKKNILIVEGNKRKLFPANVYSTENDFYVKHINLDELDLSELEKYNLVLLNGQKELSSGLQSQLRTFLENNGVLVLIPDENAETTSWNSFLLNINAPELMQWDTAQREISEILWESDFFSSVFPEIQKDAELPIVKGSWKMKKYTSTFSSGLIEFRDRNSFLEQIKFDNSYVYLFAGPIHADNGTFVKHPLLIPVTYNMVMNSSENGQLYYLCGDVAAIDIPGVKGAEHVNVEIRYDGESIIPKYRLTGNSLSVFIPEDLTESGLYSLFIDDVLSAGFALNTNSLESDLKFLTAQEIENMSSEYGLSFQSVIEANNLDISSTLEEKAIGKSIWQLFLLIALFFVIVEVALMKFMKS